MVIAWVFAMIVNASVSIVGLYYLGTINLLPEGVFVFGALASLTSLAFGFAEYNKRRELLRRGKSIGTDTQMFACGLRDAQGNARDVTLVLGDKGFLIDDNCSYLNRGFYRNIRDWSLDGEDLYISVRDKGVVREIVICPLSSLQATVLVDCLKKHIYAAGPLKAGQRI